MSTYLQGRYNIAADGQGLEIFQFQDGTRNLVPNAITAYSQRANYSIAVNNEN